MCLLTAVTSTGQHVKHASEGEHESPQQQLNLLELWTAGVNTSPPSVCEALKRTAGCGYHSYCHHVMVEDPSLHTSPGDRMKRPAQHFTAFDSSKIFSKNEQITKEILTTFPTVTQ